MENTLPELVGSSVFLNSLTTMQTMEPHYLNQYGLMAERHWRTHLPQMVARLEAEGRLMTALFEAQETTLDELETLTRRMEAEQALTPEQAQAAAWELVREKYILLPPESPND